MLWAATEKRTVTQAGLAVRSYCTYAEFNITMRGHVMWVSVGLVGPSLLSLFC